MIEGINMEDVRIGKRFLIQTIGEDFCRKYNDQSVFSYGWDGEEKGVECFVGITLHPSTEINGLSSALDDWDVYAFCNVYKGIPTLLECRLPQDVLGEV